MKIPDENFKTDRRDSKIFVHYHALNFPQFYLKSCQIFIEIKRLGSGISVPKLVHKNVAIYHLVRKKNTKKINDFQELISQEPMGLLLSNLVGKV